MVKVKYIDHEGDADEVEVFGVKFKAGKATEVSAEVAKRLEGNRFFDTQAGSSLVAPKQQSHQFGNGGSGGERQPTDDILEAVHRGRGVYAIVKGDDVLKEGLSKEDADTFNALSDEGKAAYVAE